MDTVMNLNCAGGSQHVMHMFRMIRVNESWRTERRLQSMLITSESSGHRALPAMILNSLREKTKR